MTRKESPTDFVSACGAMTANGLTAGFTFWFSSNNGKIIPAPGTGSGKVNSHSFNLALPLGALNTGISDEGHVTATFPDLGSSLRVSASRVKFQRRHFVVVRGCPCMMVPAIHPVGNR